MTWLRRFRRQDGGNMMIEIKPGKHFYDFEYTLPTG